MVSIDIQILTINELISIIKIKTKKLESFDNSTILNDQLILTYNPYKNNTNHRFSTTTRHKQSYNKYHYGGKSIFTKLAFGIAKRMETAPRRPAQRAHSNAVMFLLFRTRCIAGGRHISTSGCSQSIRMIRRYYSSGCERGARSCSVLS